MAAVLVTVVGLLAGCGSPAVEPSGQLVRLTFWSGYAGPNASALESIVDEFNAANPGVRIEMSFMPWDVFFRSLLQAYSAGGGPDLAAFDSTRVAQYAKKGVLAPVDDWFAADPASNVLVTAATEAVAYDGRKYAVPMTFTSLKLHYNRELFTRAGLDPDRPPTTWDEWREAMTRLTVDRDRDGRPEQYGLALPDHDTTPTWPIALWGGGGDVLEADGRRSALTRPESVSAVRTWVDLIREEHVSPIGLSGLEAEAAFSRGEAAMVITGPWAISGFQEAGVDFDVAPVPAGPVTQATFGATTSLALNASLSPAEKEAAHAFLSFWVSEGAQEHWMERSGYPSIRLDQNSLPSNPFVAEFADDARIARPLMPGTVEFAKIHDDVFAQAIRDIVAGKVDTAEGLAAAARRIDEILTESR
ncbi:ABC transporter substrate-binding protein [Saccharothrix hoggarensis]